MEPISPSTSQQGGASPFRRPASVTPSFPRPRTAGFGPVPAAALTNGAGRPSAAGGPRSDARAGSNREALERRRRSGALWFFWVAALTVVNSVAALAGQPWRFIVGLGITQVADALAARTGHGVAVVALVDAAFVGGFVLLGRFARQGRRWAFALGAAFYAVDGLIFVAARDWIGVAFHALVVVMTLRGLDAARRLR